MPRLFTGLEIPEDLAQRLSLLRGGLAGARWIDAENYHVTLRFIGDIDDRTADEIADAMARVRRREFDLQFSGLDSFGSRSASSSGSACRPRDANTRRM
jgi:2'-5' RNA ligase